jgi:hypothetical protein
MNRCRLLYGHFSANVYQSAETAQAAENVDIPLFASSASIKRVSDFFCFCWMAPIYRVYCTNIRKPMMCVATLGVPLIIDTSIGRKWDGPH